MARTSLRIAVVAVLLLIRCADREDYVERRDPVLLIGRFESYSSEREIISLLPGNRIETIERSGLRVGDRRPPFNVVVLAASHTHLAHSGEIRLEFFNDRLLGVTFYPENYESYIAQLEQSGVSPSTDISASARKNPNITTSPDFRGRRYVRWEDVRLQKQSNRWIARYS